MKGKQHLISLNIPDYLEPIIYAQTKLYPFYPNVMHNPMCTVCAINRTRLDDETISWCKRNICSNCDYKAPCILQHVTGVLSFEVCQMSWTLYNIEMKTPGVTQAQVEGTIGHTFDKFLADYFSKEDSYEKFKGANIYKIHTEIMKLIQAQYDKIVDEMLAKEKEDFGMIADQLLVSQKQAVFEDILNDYAYIYAIRVYKNIKHGGAYYQIPALTWREKKVVGYDEFHNVRVFQVGRIDKLYQAGENKFVIRDDKTTSVIRNYAYSPYGIYAPSKQLGAYKHLLEQMTGAKVHVLGIINLSRYFDYIPVVCDEAGYLSVLEQLCSFISNKNVALKRNKGAGVCKEEYCGFFNTCWRSPLER
jgi:hypothetical protein